MRVHYTNLRKGYCALDGTPCLLKFCLRCHGISQLP